jgi:hypothetical protein
VKSRLRQKLQQDMRPDPPNRPTHLQHGGSGMSRNLGWASTAGGPALASSPPNNGQREQHLKLPLDLNLSGEAALEASGGALKGGGAFCPALYR